MLGIRTRGRRIEGTDDVAELSWLPEVHQLKLNKNISN